MPEKNTPITDAELADLRRLHDDIERIIGPGRSTWALKGDGQGVYSIEEFDPQTQQRREIATGVLKLYALEFAALHNAFPGLLARLEAAERERDEVREYRKAETIRRTKADCYDRICEHLGVESNVLGAIAARDAQQRREGAAEWLEALIAAHRAERPSDPFVPLTIFETSAQRLREDSK